MIPLTFTDVQRKGIRLFNKNNGAIFLHFPFLSTEAVMRRVYQLVLKSLPPLNLLTGSEYDAIFARLSFLSDELQSMRAYWQPPRQRFHCSAYRDLWPQARFLLQAYTNTTNSWQGVSWDVKRAESPSNSFLQVTTRQSNVRPDHNASITIRSTEDVSKLRIMVRSTWQKKYTSDFLCAAFERTVD